MSSNFTKFILILFLFVVSIMILRVSIFRYSNDLTIELDMDGGKIVKYQKVECRDWVFGIEKLTQYKISFQLLAFVFPVINPEKKYRIPNVIQNVRHESKIGSVMVFLKEKCKNANDIEKIQWNVSDRYGSWIQFYRKDGTSNSSGLSNNLARSLLDNGMEISK
jgi:hypothetical protein